MGKILAIEGPEKAGKSTAIRCLEELGFKGIRGLVSLEPDQVCRLTPDAQRVLTESGFIGQSFRKLLEASADTRTRLFQVLDTVKALQYREALRLADTGINLVLDRGPISERAVLEFITHLHPDEGVKDWARARLEQWMRNVAQGGCDHDLFQRIDGYVYMTAPLDVLARRRGVDGKAIEAIRAEVEIFKRLLLGKDVPQIEGKPFLMVDTSENSIGAVKSCLSTFVDDVIRSEP